MSDYLAYLIEHPHYGYLFPHRLAVPVLGVLNRHHIDKHRDALTEGVDWITLPSELDHTPRVYYTLTGLPKLLDAVATPQAHAFKRALLTTLQPSTHPAPPPPGGALMSPPFPLISAATPVASPLVLPSPIGMVPPSVHSPSPDPVIQLTQQLAPTVAGHVTRCLHPLVQQMQSQPPTPSWQEVSHLYQQAQRDAIAHVKTGLDAAQQVQQHTAEHLGRETTIVRETHTQTANWLDRQDSWAVLFIGSALFALVSVATYVLFAVLTSPRPQSQSLSSLALPAPTQTLKSKLS